MNEIPSSMQLPASMADVDAKYLTRLLRARGLIGENNEVVTVTESGVGMTAGYFSDIKKMKVTFSEPTDCIDAFVVKAWPDLEIAPSETISAMFVKDIRGYMFEATQFFPRPMVILADYDVANNRFGLIMEDVSVFAEQKVHESELTFDEVMQMVPGLVDAAVAWEGCHEGPLAQPLDELGIDLWGSENNLAGFRQIMPGCALFWDKLSSMVDSSLIDTPWADTLGVGNINAMLTRKLDAFFAPTLPANGSTCTLVHGDLRGDNLFFCPVSKTYPSGWLTIDFQLLMRGPVPSDLAYLMGSGSVLPEVYKSPNRERILEAFYQQFIAKTSRYRDYSYTQFVDEFHRMSAVGPTYVIGFGAVIAQAAAFKNEQAARIELGSKPYTVDDLSPEERRQRMWWEKYFRNIVENFRMMDLPGILAALPDNEGPMGEWVQLPPHLQD
ncbi:MAG: hypothetical protein ACI82A_001895 [Candidatus Azotimanducaceae bacterium]|jgi:hypothetical protein